MVQQIPQNIQKKREKKSPRSMRLKMQKSMMVILSMTLVLFYVILSVILYNQNLSLLRAEVRQEAKYICTAVNISGTEYLEQMNNIDESTRVTRIGADGSVLYDSRRDADTLDNHSGREEVREAVKNGEGEDVRRSVTVEKDLYYYAMLLDDGSVLRVSREVDSLASTALAMLPVIGGLAVLMIIFAMLLAKWQTSRLIKPINELDLEHPLDNDVYTELSPLLTAMDRQNKEKEAVSNMRKEFSANVSHELKTPIALIQGYAEGLKEGISDDPESREFYLFGVIADGHSIGYCVKVYKGNVLCRQKAVLFRKNGALRRGLTTPACHFQWKKMYDTVMAAMMPARSASRP